MFKLIGKGLALTGLAAALAGCNGVNISSPFESEKPSVCKQIKRQMIAETQAGNNLDVLGKQQLRERYQAKYRAAGCTGNI